MGMQEVARCHRIEMQEEGEGDCRRLGGGKAPKPDSGVIALHRCGENFGRKE